MIKLFKNSKKVCSIVLSFVIVAVMFFTSGGLTATANALELNCATRNTIYWNGEENAIANGSGTKIDPYVIKSADELAWLVKQNADVTKDKYFEIDKSIGKIILQLESYAQNIIPLADAFAVKSYFQTNAANMISWPSVDLGQSSFCGNFNGNGATIYGLYQSSTNNAGLFSNVDAGASIKNIGIKNSYIKSTSGKHQVGALAAATNGDDSGAKVSGVIWFDGCVVANNYINNASGSQDSTGVVIGLAQDVVYIDNCLVYGNDATYGAVGLSTYIPTAQDAEWKSHSQDYKLLAFTFDDGPSANMSRLIDLFSLYEGTGTFFVRGISIKGDTSYDYMQSAIDAGWDIGNHGDKHLNAKTGGAGGGNATYDQIYADITNLSTKLESTLKNRDGTPYKIKYYRPPYIKTTENSFKICAELDLALIWLKRDSYDWSGSKSYADRYAIMKNGINTWNDGDIILCHEVDSMSEDTYKILVDLLPEFYEAGYRFCSISEFMQMRGITQNQISGKIENKSGNEGMVTNVLEVARDKVASVCGSNNGRVLVSDNFVKPEGLEVTNDDAEILGYYDMIRNSIIFDTPAFDYCNKTGSRFNDSNCFNGVITNIAFEKYCLSDAKVLTATDDQIKVVKDLLDVELPSSFIKTSAMPELRAYHIFNQAIDNGEAGHTVVCSCGLVDSNGAPHIYNQDNICDTCGAKKPVVPGDVNEDGKVNGKDYTLLMQYLNDWDVTINQDAADVNDDEKINGKDYTLLMQYLNDWDVELK